MACAIWDLPFTTNEEFLSRCNNDKAEMKDSLRKIVPLSAMQTQHGVLVKAKVRKKSFPHNGAQVAQILREAETGEVVFSVNATWFFTVHFEKLRLAHSCTPNRELKLKG